MYIYIYIYIIMCIFIYIYLYIYIYIYIYIKTYTVVRTAISDTCVMNSLCFFWVHLLSITIIIVVQFDLLTV